VRVRSVFVGMPRPDRFVVEDWWQIVFCAANSVGRLRGNLQIGWCWFQFDGGTFGLLGVGSAPDISGENWYFGRMNSSSVGSNA